jgi:hypothetical protein
MIDQEDVNRWTVNPDTLKQDYDELKEEHEMFTKLMADKFMEMNRGLIKLQAERDEARAEVAQLRAERDLWQQIQHDEMGLSSKPKIEPLPLSLNPLYNRLEPSRLEIAATLMSGLGSSTYFEEVNRDARLALLETDALIAAAKEVAK